MLHAGLFLISGRLLPTTVQVRSNTTYRAARTSMPCFLPCRWVCGCFSPIGAVPNETVVHMYTHVLYMSNYCITVITGRLYIDVKQEFKKKKKKKLLHYLASGLMKGMIGPGLF